MRISDWSSDVCSSDNSNESFLCIPFQFRMSGIFRAGNMDTQALAAFTEIADSGSFTQAALALHLSQPAISKRITTPEQQIGQSLFDRKIGRASCRERVCK